MPYNGTYRFSQRFGSNRAAYERFGMVGHNGVDVGLPSGTPLLAVRHGRWNRFYDPTGYGINGVLTDEEGGEWLYAHLARHEVPDGALVVEGQMVAISDNTGNSTGNHLHFAYRPRGYDRNNGYFGWINPRPYLPLKYRVALQTGHNPDGGGAPGEAEWTPRLAQALSLKLSKAGVDVVTVGGFHEQKPPALLGGDFDLFLAIHYDARWPADYTTGCCVARGTYETEHWEADRFIAQWMAHYPSATGIPLKQARAMNNENMTLYYAWRHLSYVTPGVLLEHGVGAPGVGGDADVLWGELDRVAQADADAVVAYLGGLKPVEEDDAVLQGIINELNRQVEELRKTIGERDSTIGALQAHVISPLQYEIEDLKLRLAACEARPAPEPEPVAPRNVHKIVYDDGTEHEVAMWGDVKDGGLRG
jgi:hypothetical protein